MAGSSGGIPDCGGGVSRSRVGKILNVIMVTQLRRAFDPFRADTGQSP
jgi:hypothetical protein